MVVLAHDSCQGRGERQSEQKWVLVCCGESVRVKSGCCLRVTVILEYHRCVR